MNDLEKEILEQEIASRKQKKAPKPKKEKVKKEKVFKLKKDHVACEFCQRGVINPGAKEEIECSFCQGKGQVKIVKEKKPEKTESELVHEYARKVMDGKAARGHKDERFAYTQKENQTNKQLWMDQDFQCHIVFQSKAQKYQFMAFIEEKFGFEFDEIEGHQIQIANGLRLGQAMGCDLKVEKSAPYPFANLELLPLVLDEEAL